MYLFIYRGPVSQKKKKKLNKNLGLRLKLFLKWKVYSYSVSQNLKLKSKLFHETGSRSLYYSCTIKMNSGLLLIPFACVMCIGKCLYGIVLLFCLCWGLTSQSTIFQSCRDGATASWVINQYFRGVKCLAQGHNTAAVGIEPPTSRSGVRHSTTEPPTV